jgi:hypothetical protein
MERKSLAREDLVKVYEAPDELMANSIAALLQKDGIKAIIDSHESRAFPGLAEELDGRWGDVLVHTRDENKSLELIGGFLGSLGELGEV